MDIISLRNEAIEFAKKAVELEDTNKNEEAIRYYKKAVFNLNAIIENDGNKYNKDTYSKKISEYQDRIDYLTKLISSKDEPKKEKVGGGNS
jgi:hypothetical protein